MSAGSYKTNFLRVAFAYLIGLLLWEFFRGAWIAPRYLGFPDRVDPWAFASHMAMINAFEFVAYFGLASLLWVVLSRRFGGGLILAGILGAVSFCLVAVAALALVITSQLFDIGWSALVSCLANHFM